MSTKEARSWLCSLPTTQGHQFNTWCVTHPVSFVGHNSWSMLVTSKWLGPIFILVTLQSSELCSTGFDVDTPLICPHFGSDVQKHNHSNKSMYQYHFLLHPCNLLTIDNFNKLCTVVHIFLIFLLLLWKCEMLGHSFFQLFVSAFYQLLLRLCTLINNRFYCHSLKNRNEINWLFCSLFLQ